MIATSSVIPRLAKPVRLRRNSLSKRAPGTLSRKGSRFRARWLSLNVLLGLMAILTQSASFAQGNPIAAPTTTTSIQTAPGESETPEPNPSETPQPNPADNLRSLFQILAGSDTISLQGSSPRRYTLIQRFRDSDDPGFRRLGTLLTDLYIQEDIDAFYGAESRRLAMKMVQDNRPNIIRDFARELAGGDDGLPMRSTLQGTLEAQQASRDFSRRTKPQRRFLDRRILVNSLVTQARELALQESTTPARVNPLKPLIREPNRADFRQRVQLELRNKSERTLKNCIIVVEIRANPDRINNPALVAPFGGTAQNPDEAAILQQPQMAVAYAAELGPGKALYIPVCSRFALWLAEGGTFDLFSEDLVVVEENLSELIAKQRSIALPR